MPLGEAVDLVVEQHDLHVHVAAQHMHQMVATNAEPVAVTRHQPDVERGIGELDPNAIHTPGIFVHRIVVNANPEKRIEQRTVRAQ